MTLYVCEVGPNKLISHDGHVQLGIHYMSLNEFIERQAAKYLAVHWIPDIFKHRYKRVNFQKTVKCNEGSPKTDNNGQGIELNPNERSSS